MIRALAYRAGRFAFVFNSEALFNSLARFALRLEAKAAKVDHEAGADMVELMRARVPEDTGNLLNGITLRREGNVTIVEASAVNPNDGYDYARIVEFGRPNMEAEPYFLGSAEDVLEQRGRSMEDIIPEAARESGL